MVGARHPDGAVVFQVVTATGEPLLVESVDMFGRAALVPFALVHAHHLSALHADAAIGEEVGRVGENHVEGEGELRQQLRTVALEEGEVSVGGFIEGCYCHVLNYAKSIRLYQFYTIIVVIISKVILPNIIDWFFIDYSFFKENGMHIFLCIYLPLSIRII